MSKPLADPKEAYFLVIDDDSMVREILVQYLKSFGYKNITEAKNGKLAMKVISDKAHRIDVIISDWEMPHLDGLTLLRTVRKDVFRHDVKFLMVSSQSSHERMKISKAAKAHVDAYIVKPFRAEILKKKLETLLSGGVDESAAEFEATLNRTGEVAIDDFSPDGVGHVTTDFDENAAPPENYDLKRMNITLILKLARSYNRVKWHDKAIKLCVEADQHFPNDPEILFELGHSYYFKAMYDEALEALGRAVKIKPYHIEAHTLISEIKVASEKAKAS